MREGDGLVTVLGTEESQRVFNAPAPGLWGWLTPADVPPLLAQPGLALVSAALGAPCGWPGELISHLAAFLPCSVPAAHAKQRAKVLAGSKGM